MSGNDGTGNIAERDEWETPRLLFEKLNKQYGFDTDCCANEKNQKCDTYWSNDFLNYNPDKNYDYIYWMNPPFSKAKEMFEHFFKIVKHGVAIYRFDNPETYLWKYIYENVDWVFIPRGRVNYEGMPGKGSRFPSTLVGVGVEPPINMDGTVLFVNCKVNEAEDKDAK